jgi:hypothetical protein
MGSWMRAVLLGLGLIALTSTPVAAQDEPTSDAPEAHLEVRHDPGANPSLRAESETEAVLGSPGCTAVRVALAASTVFGGAEGADHGETVGWFAVRR